MGRPLMSRPLTFLAAALYGVCWVTGPLSLLAALLALAEGGNPLGYTSTILLSFGIILLVHNRMGWFPFRRRG